LVVSPQGRVSNLNLLYDGGEQLASGSAWSGWSVVELDFDGRPRLGIRWNGSTQTPDVSAGGNPQSRRPTWFVVPEPIAMVIRAALKDAPNGV